jgi:hypothetical protein
MTRRAAASSGRRSTWPAWFNSGVTVGLDGAAAATGFHTLSRHYPYQSREGRAAILGS